MGAKSFQVIPAFGKNNIYAIGDDTSYLSPPARFFLIFPSGYVNDDLMQNPFDLIQVLCIICLAFDE